MESEHFIDLINIEVGQKLFIDSYFETHLLIVDDSSLLCIKGNYLIGKKVGKTFIKYLNKTVDVNVIAKGTTNSAYLLSDLKNKNFKFIVIGDSTSAEETYDNKGYTYCHKICKALSGRFTHNYAIGGTTVTYMYKGSNIEKEYKNNLIAIDGVRVVKKAYKNNELANIDVAFIGYGHNDRYFQPPIEDLSCQKYSLNSFNSCHSFKGSYRYIINTLRKANPKILIVILNCTYSEYLLTSKQWNYSLSYLDYRRAIYEIACEMHTKYIDPWNYMKQYYDFSKENKYYHDVVHFSRDGHAKLAEYILKN